jgi:TusA-related sulfurtransferase
MMSRIDIRSLACPMTYVRTRLALDRLAPGEVLEVLVAEGEPLENLPRTAAEDGHRVLSREPVPSEGAGSWRVLLERGP